MGISDVQSTARRALHDHMSRPATYHLANGTYVDLIHARWIEKFVKTGDLAGTNLSYAEVQEVATQVIFDREELATAGITLGRLVYVVFSDERGYVVDNILPADGMTVTAEVTRMTAAEFAGKTLPSDVV